VRRNLLLLPALLLIAVGIISAQMRTVKINSIVVEGNHFSETSSIRQNSGLYVGMQATGDDFQKAVKQLWELQIFSDVKIYSPNPTTDAVDIIIRVQEYPKLRNVQISGNDEIDTDDIEDEINVYRGMSISSFKISKIKQTIKKMYEEEGFLLAVIDISTAPMDTGYVNLVIDVAEGKEVQIEKIRFHDNEAIEDGDLRGAMEDTKEDRWWRSADFNRQKFDADLERVVDYYREHGYRDAEVMRDSISYSEDKQDLYIDIWMYEGNKYYFGDISFSGNTIFTAQQLEFEVDIQRGDDFNQKKYTQAIGEKLQKLYYNQGYLFANIQPQETPVGVDTLNINFNITENHIVHVKEIVIRGNSKTNEKVLRREFKIHPGDVFNSSKLERSLRELMILNYFSNVLPNVEMIKDDDKHVNLDIEVAEKSTDMANMSAGYSQRDGLIGSLGLTFNNFSMAHPFGGGDGQRLAFDWQFGKYYRSISVSFTEPWLFNTPTLGGFSVFNTRVGGNYYYPWNRRDIGGSIHIGRRFRWPDNYFRGDWILRVANTRITDISEEYKQYYPEYGDGTNIQQISVTQVYSRDSRDQPEFPTYGSVNSLSFQLSGGPLGGTADYTKTIFQSEWFVPLPFKFVLYTQMMYGFMKKLSPQSIIPFGEYFYLGGSGLGLGESLRGYDDGAVGPLTSSGRSIGGKSLVKNSVELRIPIAPNPTIFGLLFMDAGNSWEKIPDTDPFDLKRSVGLGIRLFMPMVGIIGIDFGYGFDHINQFGKREGQWKYHFRFGRF
jgi:outer membrane protein insertion porin family